MGGGELQFIKIFTEYSYHRSTKFQSFIQKCYKFKLKLFFTECGRMFLKQKNVWQQIFYSSTRFVKDFCKKGMQSGFEVSLNF